MVHSVMLVVVTIGCVVAWSMMLASVQVCAGVNMLRDWGVIAVQIVN